MWTDWLMRLGGLVLLGLVLTDVYTVVLFPQMSESILSLPLSRGVWRLFCLLAKRLPLNRDRFLTLCGPTLLVIIIALWIGLLLVGFALLFWPALGQGIQASKGQTPSDFITAFYFSGYTLTTLGTGDLVPKTGLYRLMTIAEAVLGFSVFTLTLTYVLSIYSAVQQRNTFALSLHYQAGERADAAELIANWGAGGNLSGVRQEMSKISTGLLGLMGSHHSYPILLYFRFKETEFALARIGLLILDTSALLRCGLDPVEYKWLLRSAALIELQSSIEHLLLTLSETSLPHRFLEDEGASAPALRRRYFQAIERLRQEGIHPVNDVEIGVRDYIALRQKWEPYLKGFSDYMEYRWTEVDPAVEQ